ncbi:MAG: hypothetical protein ACLGI2_09575 [Acidimicrobiia bacterium]
MTLRKWFAAGSTAAAVVLAATATAWACVSGPAVNLSTTTAKAGDEVMINGTGFRQPHPVTVRFNALDGPVLATLDAPKSDRTVTGAVTVPQGTAPGNYVLILSQTGPDGKLSQLPIRALLAVVGPTGQQPIAGASLSPVEERPVGLIQTDNDIAASTLALIFLGVAGAGMFAAGMAALFAGRRGRAEAPVAAKVRE